MAKSHTDALRIDEVLRSIEEMQDLLHSEAEASERLRRPTPAVQEALKDCRVFQLLMPNHYGGMEAGPVDVLKVVSKLSYADASIGWLARVLMYETAISAKSLPEATAHELFQSPKPKLLAGVAQNFNGKAQVVDGGLVVEGTWTFVPGVTLASYVNLGVIVEETGDRLVCTVPRSSLSISDNWNMLGLRYSASLDYTAKELFVPTEYTFMPEHKISKQHSDIFDLDPQLVSRLFQSAWGQGVGARILDELKSLTQANMGDVERDVTSPEFYAEFARHYTHVESTNAFLRELWAEVEENLAEGEPPSVETQTLIRLSAALSTRTVLEISNLAHRFAGGYVMRDSPIQRFFRDGHAGTQHRGTAHFVTQQAGELLTGVLPADTYWSEDDSLSFVE